MGWFPRYRAPYVADNVSKLDYLFRMLITFEWKVLQRSAACQNEFKSKGYLPKTTAVIMQKVKVPPFNTSLDFSPLKSASTALQQTYS